MTRFQPNVYEDVQIEQLLQIVGTYREQGYRFVQICATTLEESCELLYTFIAPGAVDGALLGLNVNVPDGMPVPSITEFYPAAFVFENETHDLFGIDIYGINLDFHGEFYKVSEKFPMNPRAALEDRGSREEAAHE